MGKFRTLNLKLETNQEATFGDSDEGKIYYDGTTLVVSGTGINVKLAPDNRVVLDGVAFPTDAGTFDQVLTLSGTTDAQWGDFDVSPPPPVVGDRGVIGGGKDIDTGVKVNTMEYITISTTGNATNFGDLQEAKVSLSGFSNGGGGRGIFGAGNTGSKVNTIDYLTISTPGNSNDFGDLTVSKQMRMGVSNGTNNRGVFGGGNTSNDTIEYITISVAGNATDFGNLLTVKYGGGSVSNATNNRGVYGGGWISANTNVIEYITITSAGNATDFGNLTQTRRAIECGGVDNGTNNRGVFCGGYVSSPVNTMDYITISSTGNATNFGDLIASVYGTAGCSNGTNDRGIIASGNDGGRSNVIQYIAISSTGNATNFGDLIVISGNTPAGLSNA